MKSLVRWGTKVGLIGSTLLATVASGTFPVVALPESEVVGTLNEVPVFMVTNKNGVPLSRPIPAKKGEQGSKAITGVYMSRQEAQTFVSQLQSTKTKDPKQAQMFKELTVTAVPLGLIYKQLQNTKNQQNRLLFAFKPVDKEVQGAMELLRKNGQKVEKMESVPLFFVRFAPDKGYVSIKPKEGNKEFIPAFTSKQDAIGLLNQVKPKYKQADIQVADIDGVIKVLKEKDDEWLKQVTIVPSPESRKFIQTLPRNSNNAPKKK
ncbi:MAG: Tic22 family protein [Cyanobacteria bacterium P01_A01_bin.45]